MKKVLLLTLTLSLLASCSSETEAPLPDSSTTPPSVTIPSDQNDGNATGSATEKGEAPDPSQDAGAVETSPDESVPPMGDTSPELLSNEQSLLFADAIFDNREMEANEALPIITSPDDPMNEFIFPLLGFTPEDAESFAISVSGMMVQAYGIVAVKPVEGQEEAVKAGLQGFIDTQIQSFTNYLVDQLELAQAARLETLDDGTILLVLCPDQDNVFDGIVASLA